jgi:hypothetical protein
MKATMTQILGNARRNSTWIAALVLLTATTPVTAQEFDPALGAEALAVMGDGRIVLQNGDDVFDCALIAGQDAVTVGDCRPGGDAMALLSALSDEDWQALVRDTLLDERCRLSAFGAVAEVVAAAAEANGVDPATIEGARAALSARADAAVAQMLRDGRLTYRGGELALDACP